MHRLVAQIVRHVEHRADREIDLVRTQQREAVLAGHVVQLQFHARMLCTRNAATNGGSRYWIVDVPAAMCSSPPERPARSAWNLLVEAIESFDQRQHEIVQHPALAGQRDAASALDQTARRVPAPAHAAAGSPMVATGTAPRPRATACRAWRSCRTHAVAAAGCPCSRSAAAQLLPAPFRPSGGALAVCFLLFLSYFFHVISINMDIH